MVFNTTYTSKETSELIDDCLGKPFSFMCSLKLGGVDSKRMIIEEVSKDMTHLLNKVSDVNYGNLELRPKGLIIRIKKGLETFCWMIPYHQLVIFKTDGLSIHAQGKFIRFRNNNMLKENKNFLKKLIGLKATNQEQHAIPLQ